MASRSRHGGHLDATAGREVVYCHACACEWYRDEHGLTCPDCGGDVTEIVSPENDPREPDSAPSSPGLSAARFDGFPDPEEADIEEHVGPHGFVHRRSVRTNLDNAHHDPEIDPVLQSFYEMIQNLSQPRAVPQDDRARAWPRVHRTTFASGNFGSGTASVTIFSGPAPGRHQMGYARDGGPADPFQAIFSDVLRDVGPPQGGHAGGPPSSFARSLQELFNMFSPANAMSGDAVYSQEALDRIITQLMEANPQSNAAPPASEEALGNLDRRTVDEAMLKGESKAECTICIDEVKIGDRAVVLPCKHWFHEECVVLWLKEHNTCPICRTPIETSGGNGNGGNNTGGSSAWNAGTPRPGPGPHGASSAGSSGDASGSLPRGVRGGFGGSFGGSFNRPGEASADASAGSAAPGSRPSRLDDAFRTMSTMQQERDRRRGSGPRRTSQVGYDTSQLQGPGAGDGGWGEYERRTRQRSRSESSRRGQTDRVTGRPAGQGPIMGWLRERFIGNGGSHQGSSRDERRY